jgi:hypothetical protein
VTRTRVAVRVRSDTHWKIIRQLREWEQWVIDNVP